MKKLLLTTLLLNCIFSFSQENKTINLEELRKQQIENLTKPELWDIKRMKNDIDANINNGNPFHSGAFPVPHYSLLGVYGGLGQIGNTMARSFSDYKLMVKDKEIVFNSIFHGKSKFYPEKSRKHAFFTIITVIDTVAANNTAISPFQLISRNHPDYGGQGSIQTKNNKVDYVAFTTPDKGSFAIVNMRLFHLEYGNIIIVTPQKDGSFRSMQIKGDKVPQNEYFSYIKNNVLKRDDIIKFLTEDGVI
ncbi:hypothetical protein K8354_03175 [Polaribacter litorisediminis]|uniref:hypothetical protein n=1 Tax=Polaribacter litorisediminis TaxID=1908341 RepID=UPI001CBCFED0|nr:hypothetical protein [Polaribacter litorisediminis]UAM98839.1 hypothetical protein K8354_03175 [Polaribacter litorisediminis]